ncbi:peptidase M14 [Geothrix limicola]|uniref:Peptidase M14 n=1 Tax=Geothrix limicola TaxID=2927978 RepID=A0ABQ5QF72_9BACT|nr:M14 family zinc carboxypeptidase [Geothrix limicola]GLH73494.1 peptidase M14 [Geothrix limicola]
MPRLPLLEDLERTIEAGGARFEARRVCEVECRGDRMPVYVVLVGNPDPQAPAVGFFGGVHGLERIGAEVVLAYLQNLAGRLRWDDTVEALLASVRMVFMPLVNPGGTWLGTRANPSGVDLMRNAPVESKERVPWLIGGQRFSPRMPWFRGALDQPMEAESRALCEVVSRELLSRRCCVAVDCHSGFGMADRIWFPYAHTRAPIPHLPEMHALRDLLQETLCNYRYIFEPQSLQYLTHGDLWDHLYLQSLEEPSRVFLPLTLEMGSWSWVKKNPRQFFTLLGNFNPLIEHRQQRVLRRHVPLLEFFARAAASHRRWLPTGAEREQHRARAMDHWYPGFPWDLQASPEVRP